MKKQLLSSIRFFLKNTDIFKKHAIPSVKKINNLNLYKLKPYLKKTDNIYIEKLNNISNKIKLFNIKINPTRNNILRVFLPNQLKPTFNNLRTNRFFNKSRFSRNRQICKNIVYLGLLINTILVIELNASFYNISIDKNSIILLLYLSAYTILLYCLITFFLKK